jgi:hypothetical protein
MEGVTMLITRGVLVFLMAALSIECAQLSATSQGLPNRTAVTVQIRDYARVKPKSLAKAKEIATRMYRRAGIGLEWLGDVAEDSRGAHDVPRVDEWRTPAAQLTIDIVTASIAKRRGYSADVVGFVTVPPEGGMGRIGYVVYERIKDVAAGGQSSTGEILGIIIAHDIGRLILGAGSGTFSGVMTRTWNREELQRVNPMALAFTPAETERLHATLRRDSGTFPVGTAGSEPDESIATGDDVVGR